MKLKFFNATWFKQVTSSWYMTILCLFCVLVWAIGDHQVVRNIQTIPNLMVQDVQCETTNLQSQSQLLIYSNGEASAKLLNQLACDDQIVNRQFGSVKTFWRFNDVNTIQYIGKGQADLALVKENMMAALSAEETHGYKKIAYYPNYPAFFIARTEKPILTKAYFIDKTIGLVNYPTSRSGHILPKRLLSQLGLSFDKLNIKYARSHQELRDWLEKGDVDIISTYWKEEDAEHFSMNYRAEIADSITGSAWYIKLETDNLDLLCAAQTILNSMSKLQSQSYYQNLSLVPFAQCEEQYAIIANGDK